MVPWSCLMLLLLVPAAIVQAACSTDPCVMDCTDCAAGEGTADPEDCRRYYVCDGKGNVLFPEPLECDEGQVFDSNNHTCVTGTSCTPCSPKCYYDCTHTTNPRISNFYDCSIYFECDSSDKPGLPQSCPLLTPYFDGVKCQTDPTRCCHCHAYCYDAYVDHLVPDPTDCRRFYACMSPGLPIGSGSCGPREFFDSHLGYCSSHASCNTLCTNVVGSDGCIAPYTCVEEGSFPKCPFRCKPEYYHCTEISDTYIEPDSCPIGYFFHPIYHMCYGFGFCPF